MIYEWDERERLPDNHKSRDPSRERDSRITMNPGIHHESGVWWKTRKRDLTYGGDER